MYGDSMFQNDVGIFQQTGDEAPNVQDRYATGFWLPREDKINNYEDVTITKNGDKYNFVAYRKLNTQDYDDDTVIKCGSTNKWNWAGSTWTGALIKHDTRGPFVFTLADGCTHAVAENATYVYMSSVLMACMLSLYAIM